MSAQAVGVAAPGQAGLYFQLMDKASGLVANGAGMEAWNQAHWANYVVPAAEQTGSGRYTAAIPGYVPLGKLLATLYIPVGGGPASGDTPIDKDDVDWDGGNLVALTSPLNIGKINGSAPAAVNLALSGAAIVPGAAAAGTLSTSQMTTNLGSTIANVYAGRILLFTSGGNNGRAALITAYAVTGAKLTFVAYSNGPISVAPTAGDTFVIL